MAQLKTSNLFSGVEQMQRVPEEAISYRLRMIYNKWFILFYNKAGENFSYIGPSSYADASANAEKLTLPDLDKA
jgi:hypothetical protein